MTNFLKIATKEVSSKTGLPKLLLINVAHIVTVEKCLWECPVGMDVAPDMIDGSTIIVQASAHHVIEIDTRDPYENVCLQLEGMNGVTLNA